MTTETKALIGILAATVLIVVGGAFLMNRGGSGQGGEPVAQADRLVRDDDPVFGAADAPVTLVEFGDFECPSCGMVYPALKEIKTANEAHIRFVFRNFPLPQHNNAALAAEAALEAQRQGKFWEYHDLLFENQSDLERAGLERQAEKLGLNMDEFRHALDKHTHQAAVAQDRTDGQALGINGTPTLFINGVRYAGNYSVAQLQDTIDRAAQTSGQ